MVLAYQGWSEVKVIVDGLTIRGTVSTPSGSGANIQQYLTGSYILTNSKSPTSRGLHAVRYHGHRNQSPLR